MAEHRFCGSWDMDQENYDKVVSGKDESNCFLGEEAFVEFLQPKRKYEVMGSLRNIITCDVIDLIRENDPNVIFMEYSKSDELQRAMRDMIADSNNDLD